LSHLAPKYQWQLSVAHFNHHLRGRSSDADERLVKRTAENFGLPFFTGRGDVKSFARRKKLSLEMAARELRHGFFAKAAAKHGIRRIALAHHADDQVELFFLRLLRGAGGEGGGGMKRLAPSPKDNKILLVRPLLDLPKSALAAYAKEQGIVFREDATNAQIEIQRNHIRHKLLPRLTKEFQPALSRIVLRQMEIVGAEAEFVTQAAQGWLKAQRRQPFAKLAVALQRRCVQLRLVALGIAANFDLVEQLREFENQPITVSEGIAIYREASGELKIKTIRHENFDQRSLNGHLQGRAGEIVFDTVEINWSLQPLAAGPFRVPKKKLNAESFDADKVGIDIILRHWEKGDRFQPIGMPGPVKLQDLFINAKFPRERRHQLLVGTTSAGVLFWVEGLRLGECFKLDKNTRKQLNWRWKRLC
jgi:tRNA(Ile)-lysidine synthase